MTEKDKEKLYKSAWNIVIKRSGNDKWEFKQYILSLLFYRYLSEDFNQWINENANAGKDFNYSDRSDDESWIEVVREHLTEEKGYFIYPSQLFSNLKKRMDNCHLIEEITEIFKSIEESSEGDNYTPALKGLFKYINFRDLRLGGESNKIIKSIKALISDISTLQIPKNDLSVFSDVFEYLVGMYLTKTNKSKKEHYTYPEISELLVEIICSASKKIKSIYDPTCGFGSTILKFLKKFKSSSKLTFFGQEIDFTMYQLCKMNMLFHNVHYSNFQIESADTLKNDKFGNKKFDVVIADLPFLKKWELSTKRAKEDPRFSKISLNTGAKADIAFLQHSIYHLKENGIGAVVCHSGALSRDNKDKDIRKYLIQNKYIDAVIKVSGSLFARTTQSVYILIFKKTNENSKILFIDASSFVTRGSSRNSLSKENINAIMNFYRDRKDIENYVKLVDIKEIEEKNYVLTADRYLSKELVKEEININEINKAIEENIQKANSLRKDIDLIIEQIPLKKIVEFEIINGIELKKKREIKPLSEVIEDIQGGYTLNNLVKSETKGIELITYKDLSKKGLQKIYKGSSLINSELLENKRTCKYGDILVIAYSAYKEIVGKPILYLGSEECIVAHGIYIIKHKENPNYIVHALNSDTFRDQLSKAIDKKCEGNIGDARINSTEIKQMNIPLPSASIQSEIADILDKFLELENELGLEINNREKQYEYYRDLLIVGEDSINPKYPLKTLQEITNSISPGGTANKINFMNTGIPVVTQEDLNSSLPLQFTECVNFINPNTVKGEGFFKYGDILIAKSSANVEDTGKVIIYLNEKEKALANSSLHIIRPRHNPKYLFYALSTHFCRWQLQKDAHEQEVISINVAKLSKLQIPFPPSEEQRKIVSVLDKFYKAFASEEEGVPRLIKENRLQYEHYKERIIN